VIKDIVVHLTGSEEDDTRLAHAETIARTFGAHVTGIYVHSMPELFTIADATAAAAVADELIKESQQRADLTTTRLTTAMDALESEHDLRRFDLYSGTVGDALATVAHTADLFVGTRPYGDPTGQEHVEEQVLFQSGRGCLFVPPQGKPPRQYASILVAWKDSREAARALSEALPLLQQARQVIVALVEPQGASERLRIEAGAEIGRHLSRHGVSAEIRKIGGWANVGEALLNEASQTGSDMIVMGGYGHSRLREFVLGGATRHVLANSTIPVLMAH
jgi:nucleotide-binding universal stress UspA family protein